MLDRAPPHTHVEEETLAEQAGVCLGTVQGPGPHALPQRATAAADPLLLQQTLLSRNVACTCAPCRNTVHLAAPGESIYSTARDGGYVIMHGTSMACPLVAGAAALLQAAATRWASGLGGRML